MSLEYNFNKAIKQVEGKSHPLLREAYKVAAIIVGAILVGVGLEYFLVPNGFIDGGITGISIIISTLTPLSLSLCIALINLPFIVLSFRKLGKRASLKTAIGIGALVATTTILHHVEPATHEFTLALGYGGVLVGAGVGIALRYGGALDGAESLSVIISQRSNFNIEQVILFLNLGIFIVAAFTISAESAMASFLLFYLVVTPIIGKVMDGGREMKTATIITTHCKPIIEEVHEVLNRRVIVGQAHRTIIDDTEEESVGNVKILTVIVARSEEDLLSSIVEKHDGEAILIFQDAASIHGGVFNKDKHH